MLCHIDKRPDVGLHRDLAAAGVLLEYDTFFRPKYDPERNVWPLVERMLADGYAASIAIGTDLADAPGLARPRPGRSPARFGAAACRVGLRAATWWPRSTGENIVARLARAVTRRITVWPCHGRIGTSLSAGE